MWPTQKDPDDLSAVREDITFWVGTDPNWLCVPKDPHLQKGIKVRVQNVQWRNYFLFALHSNDHAVSAVFSVVRDCVHTRGRT